MGWNTVARNWALPAMMGTVCLVVTPAPAAVHVKLGTAVTGTSVSSATERRTETFALKSADGLDYRIFLSVPPGEPPATGFPVVYVTDANAWFGPASEVARLNDTFERAVIVGIGYPTQGLLDLDRRIFDFTETTPFSALNNPVLHRKNGGAQQFHRFIQGELKRVIAEKVKIDEARETLFGHSLGGLFSLYVLFTAPDSFDTYIAASPSIWWNHNAILKHEEAFRGKLPLAKEIRVMLAAGEWEQFERDAASAKLRRQLQKNPQMDKAGIDALIANYSGQLDESRVIDNAREMANRLQKAGVQAEIEIFADEDHMSTVVPILNRAIPFSISP